MISIQVSGMNEVLVRIAKLKSGLEHREFIISKCGDILVADVRKNIQTEGKRLEIGWQALKPYTQRKRKEHGYPPDHPILIETGAMIAGIRKTKNNNIEAVIEPTGSGGIPAETNIAKASRHQFGQKERNIPPRRFFEISKSGIKEVKRAIEEYVIKLLKS